ncbi:hypothetical protein LJR030_002750 [Rhizobium sp. LjRoot30]|uniref:hypothetical protein n=1 Tax=Rhizobium sp. LjRoot30 TaxID=3342320 RepID=UPI003ECC6570
MLRPVTAATYQVGVIGIIIWAVSWGTSHAGIGLALGGLVLFIMPLALPHYLGVACRL